MKINTIFTTVVIFGIVFSLCLLINNYFIYSSIVMATSFLFDSIKIEVKDLNNYFKSVSKF